MSLKVFLPLYLVAYFFAAFFWRSYMVWKRTGVNPLVFKGSDNAHDYIGQVENVARELAAHGYANVKDYAGVSRTGSRRGCLWGANTIIR